MNLAKRKTEKIKLLEETRARRAEIQDLIEGFQDNLARERAAKLSGEGNGSKIPALQEALAQLEEELSSLQVDGVLERQIQEIERQEHQEAVREAEEQRAAAIQGLEESLAAYRAKRVELLGAAYALDEAREVARSAHFRWLEVSGTPWSPEGMPNLYNWDAQQNMALRILQAVIDGHKAAQEWEELRARNPQLYGG